MAYAKALNDRRMIMSDKPSTVTVYDECDKMNKKSIYKAILRLHTVRLPEICRERLALRVSKKEKAEIRRSAARLGCSVSSYLLALHRYVSIVLELRKDEFEIEAESIKLGY